MHRASSLHRTLVPRGLLVTLALLSWVLAGCAARLSPSWPGVDVEDATLYLSAGTRIVALDIDQGQPRWQRESENGRLFTTPPRRLRQPLDAVLVGDQMGRLYALNPQDGQVLWTFDAMSEQPFVAEVTTDGRALFVPHSSGTLYALDSQGKVLWTFTASGPLWAGAPVLGDRLLLPGMDHNLYALSTNQGRLLWQVGLDAALGAAPLLHETTVFVPTYGAGLYAVDADTGRVLWRALEDQWLWHTPVLGDGRLYVGTLQGTLYALDPATGQVQWQRLLDAPIAVAPAWDDRTQRLYAVTEAGSLWVLDGAGGEPLNRFNREDWEKKLYTSPVPTPQGVLLVVNENPPQVVLLEPMTGQVQWQFSGE